MIVFRSSARHAAALIKKANGTVPHIATCPAQLIRTDNSRALHSATGTSQRASWAFPQTFDFPNLGNENEHNAGLKVFQFPLLNDNYGFLMKWSGATANDGPIIVGVDLPQGCAAEYCEWAKDELGGPITDILVTHWHWDHLGGFPELKANGFALNGGVKPRAYGSRLEMETMSKYASESDFEDGGLFQDGDWFNLAGLDILVRHLPGHTKGHIGFFVKDTKATNGEKPYFPIAFTGDVVFPLGCGRLFEGTYEEGHSSLCKILKPMLDYSESCKDSGLDKSTLIFCAHEYTMDSAQFHMNLLGLDVQWEDEHAEKYVVVTTDRACVKNVSSGKLEFPFKGLGGDTTDPYLNALLPRVLANVELRRKGLPTVPFCFQEDVKTNLFLAPTMIHGSNSAEASGAAAWKQLRQKRNEFKVQRPWPIPVGAKS